MSNGRTVRSGPVVLVVLDGWGYREDGAGNALEMASLPTWRKLWSSLPRTLLEASGLEVGLPAGQMGNSEVGHLNLGAGRTVPQDLVRISEAIRTGGYYENEAFVALANRVKATGGTLHLYGLLGDGGVHAIDEHLFALIEFAHRMQLPKVAIQAVTDGRDTMPNSGRGYMEKLLQVAAGRARVATIVGRYFAMDRDKRWDRTKLAYDAMMHGAGLKISDPLRGIEEAYARGETDEFIKPLVVCGADGEPIAPIRPGDGIICFNYRADRMRQMVRAWTLPAFDGFQRGGAEVMDIVTMTQYDATFTAPAAFGPLVLTEILAEVVSREGMAMLRTAETEKYAHVTYFFNGGIETPYPNEERILVDSQKVATYDLKPEMSAAGITDVLCRGIEARAHEFILANYANADMVGHTGVLPAVITAVETVDACLSRVMASAAKAGASVMITADHGNCEMMIDPLTGGPHTAHTSNPVPFVLHHGGFAGRLRKGGALRDVGPTLLGLLGIAPPAAMTGRDLRTL